MNANLFDLVVQTVANEAQDSRRVSQYNSILIHDTPLIWGKAFDSIQHDTGLSGAAMKLSRSMADIISGGKKLIDIVSLGAPDGFFKDDIAAALREAIRATKGEVVIRLLFGFIPIFDATKEFKKFLLSNVIKPLGNCPAPSMYYGSFEVVLLEPAWNHCKIVAADGIRSIVGGHNLWAVSYGSYPPAHDISIEVEGQAALDSQHFIEYMWSSTNMVFSTLRPGTCGNTEWLPNTRPPLPSGWSGIDKLKAPVKEQYNARIMSLGRCYQLINPSGASDIAKKTVILNAKKSLKISQQDMVFNHFPDSEHLVCQYVAQALIGNKDLIVQIAVSPIQAWAGPQFLTANGASYSWGAGAIGTVQMIVRFIDELTAGNRDLAHAAYDRLQVAPFCFTDVTFDVEQDYVWPGLGKIADPYPTGINTYPSPANHAKFYMADDSICYIGSDNLYPNSNAEFGYLIESGDANFTNIKTHYWDNVWQYSARHTIPPSRWYYARVIWQGSFIGWVGASGDGYVLLCEDIQKDPSPDPTKANAQIVGFEKVGDNLYLRAPAYYAHNSASIGGSDGGGVNASWHRGETSGYKVRLGPDNTLLDEFDRTLCVVTSRIYTNSLYGYWLKDPPRDRFVTLEFIPTDSSGHVIGKQLE